MKKVLAQGTKYIFGVFSIAILGLLMSLTYQALQRIFPTSFINQIWGLVLFDIAAICWALSFVYASETVAQYATAAIGFLTGFIGTLGMVAAEVILGQNLIQADQSQVGQWLVYGFIGATALHAALLYAHHAAAPDIHQKIDVGIARGEITSEAIKQATATLDTERRQLAESIRDEIIANVKRDLNIPILADPRMPFLPAEPKQYEQKTLPFPTEAPCTECGQLPSKGHHHRCSQWISFTPQDKFDGRPAVQVPADVYNEIKSKYPTVPGLFRADPKNEESVWQKINGRLESVKQDLINASQLLTGKHGDQDEPTTAQAPFPKPESDN